MLRIYTSGQAQLLLRSPFGELFIWTRFGDPSGPPNRFRNCFCDI